jgi:polar amino acid transport system permease protein
VWDSAVDVFFQGRNMVRLLEGLAVTLKISVTSVVLSLFFGFFVGLMMTSGGTFRKAAARVYLESVRIIPVLVFLFLFYYSLSKISDINLSAVSVALLVFTLWGTAEMADLVRGALTSIPLHQRESALALGLTEAQTQRYVVCPQAVRRLLPGVINLTTRMIKTTPLVFFISVPELTNVGQQIVEVAAMTHANYLAGFWVYGAIFFIYFALCYPISRLSALLEKRWAV